jgi:hypothetical protein
MLRYGMVGLLLAVSCAAPVGLDQSLAPQSTIAASSPCHSINGRADSHCTPGLWAHSPDVTADAPQYLHTLCQPPLPKGFTEKRWIEKRRPPTSYTRRIEPQLMKAYGYAGDPANFELDHIGALELDGDPGYTAYVPSGMPANLYPQPWEGLTGARVKDREENLLHRQVCSGGLTLEQAQAKLIRDWVK